MEHDHDRPHEPPHRTCAEDYESPGHLLPQPYVEMSPKELAAAATERRLAREEAVLARGQVAGHDFPREAAEREQDWDRGR